jgi:hypothetical protein
MACKLTYKGKQYDSDSAVIFDVIKDRNLVAEYNALMQSGVDSSIEELETFANEKNRALELLPDNVFTFTDTPTILKNVINNGITFGYLHNLTIFLAKNLPIGTGYHEAFHGIYRTFLNDNQIQHYYKLAEQEYGKPTAAELNKLRASSSQFTRLNNTVLEQLYYEEKMAEKFREYMLNRKPKTKLARLFSYLKKIINWFKGTPTDINTLFEDIATGKFKDAKPVYNVFRKSKPVFSIRSVVNDSVVLIDSADEQQVISTVASLMLKDGISKVTPNTLKKYLDIASDKFNPLRWMKFLQNVNENKRQQLINRLNGIYTALSTDKYFDGTNIAVAKKDKIINNNIKVLAPAIQNFLDLYYIDKQQELAEEEESQTNDNERPGLGIEDSGTKGSIYKMNKFFRTYIASTTLYKDHFDIGLDFSDEFINTLTSEEKELLSFYASPSVVINTYRKQLSNTPKNKIFEKFVVTDSSNPEVKAFKDKVIRTIQAELKEAGVEEKYYNRDYIVKNAGSIPYLNVLTKSNMFNSFVNAFNVTLVNFHTLAINENYGDTVLHNANAINEQEKKLYEWRNNATAKGLNYDETMDTLLRINNELKGIENIDELAAYQTNQRTAFFDNKAANITKLFNDLGITISNNLVLYQLLALYIETKASKSPLNAEELSSVLESEGHFTSKHIGLFNTYYNVSTMAYSTNDVLRLKPIDTTRLSKQEELETNLIHSFFTQIKDDYQTELRPVEKYIENSFTSKGKTMSPLYRLAAFNSMFDEDYRSLVARTAEGKTVNSIGLPNFLSNLILTLKSKDMEIFINEIKKGNYSSAKNMLYKMFGLDSMFQYDDFTIDKLFNSYVNNVLVTGVSDNVKPGSSINYNLKKLFFKYLSNSVTIDVKYSSSEENLYGNINSREFSKLDETGKLVTKMALFNKPEDTATTFSHFIPQVHENKKYNRTVEFPVFKLNDRQLNQFGVEALTKSIRAEYNNIRDNVQYMIDIVNKDGTLKQDSKLIDKYNVFYDNNNNIFVPIFEVVDGNRTVFKQFAKYDMVFTDGILDWKQSKLDYENTGNLTVNDLPRGYNFGKFKEAGLNKLRLDAIANKPMENVDGLVLQHINDEYNRFINKLETLKLLEVTDDFELYNDPNC